MVETYINARITELLKANEVNTKQLDESKRVELCGYLANTITEEMLGNNQYQSLINLFFSG